jgi:hypothetical protein
MPDRRYNKRGYWFSRVAPLAVPAFGNNTERERLSWLLDFAQRHDLTRLGGYKMLRGLAEVAYFAAGGGWNSKVRSSIEAADLDRFAIFVRTGLADFLEGRAWSLRAGERLVVQLQRTGINRPNLPITAMFPLRVPVKPDVLDEIKKRVGQHGSSQKEPAFETRYVSDNLLTVARWRALQLIATNFDAIGRCRRVACGKFFVINRRQEYCSRQCSHIERSTKWREQNLERARKLRHEAYKRKVAREKGAAAARHVRTRIKKEIG